MGRSVHECIDASEKQTIVLACPSPSRWYVRPSSRWWGLERCRYVTHCFDTTKKRRTQCGASGFLFAALSDFLENIEKSYHEQGLSCVLLQGKNGLKTRFETRRVHVVSLCVLLSIHGLIIMPSATLTTTTTICKCANHAATVPVLRVWTQIVSLRPIQLHPLWSWNRLGS